MTIPDKFLFNNLSSTFAYDILSSHLPCRNHYCNPCLQDLIDYTLCICSISRWRIDKTVISNSKVFFHLRLGHDHTLGIFHTSVFKNLFPAPTVCLQLFYFLPPTTHLVIKYLSNGLLISIAFFQKVDLVMMASGVMSNILTTHAFAMLSAPHS